MHCRVFTHTITNKEFFKSKRRVVIDIFVLISAGTVVVVLLIFLFVTERYDRRRDRSRPVPTTTTPKTTKCPLCGSELSSNRRVKSVLFPGKPDSMMEINGCPYCYPYNTEIKRICPVCKKEVPENGHVIARVFIKPNKKHVHVLGCTGCYKRKIH
ncbi:MAG: hypothetical protein HN737_11510 [Desulfobacterales bacterium]|nr:hypothetical protein [Desulfobacterales bacterium]MBT7698021.1 hypothetical protein [Desulfobacterales bacterium]